MGSRDSVLGGKLEPTLQGAAARAPATSQTHAGRAANTEPTPAESAQPASTPSQAKTEEQLQSAISAVANKMGMDHPLLIVNLSELGLLYLLEGRYVEAESTYRRL